ncbi:UDP-N-acetylmuramoyl-L-alanyl-D-glutamate--2,6-diaminopimelate ligase [Sediminibacillus halophilus]|uniref:UDP-N-acetylmuramyl-tripeptide synthetase n=1 Tax=Sediminibacillus halophilus TaxID=482461 RepID=A0A1G9M4R9_9BACI|nr:UDP-N-acetylmuramoyl-L-alanyl-D-glutamate--2,6-diaminopimelate ligase [Sediminibacillus halophilus]SDL69260.1 UDP-N-acetylmuramoyl-L-alanyl-D-glutamate--2,6-diaminopimelate ligase [Sediminibacillus halophilus]
MNINFDNETILNVEKIHGPLFAEISSLNYDSRRIEKNAAFFCMEGEQQDGHLFIEDAIKKGASAIIGSNEAKLARLAAAYPDRTFVVVKDTREAMARLSILFYQQAYKKLTTIGVTGTNGKTTVVAYIYSLLNQIGKPTGSIGTIGTMTSEGPFPFQPTTPTTPEAPDLHYLFHQFLQRKEQAAAMEVSSIAIEQKRVEGISFHIGVHTNISSEHLDFHKTFENYKKAKLKLFKQTEKAVVNLDDKGMAEDILDLHHGPLLTYSINGHPDADVFASNIRTNRKGSAFLLSIEGRASLVHTPIIGHYNISNLLAAVCTALHTGVIGEKILEKLPKIKGPKGRFQLVETPGNSTVLLDYAHTPEALRKLLTEVKKLNYRKLILMVTGVGIRDKNKMAKMGEAADGQADAYIISVDHPGYRKPEEIVASVLSGFSETNRTNITVTHSRKEGVIAALNLAEKEDLIILTGGCINGCQIIRGKALPHSDETIIEHFYSTQVNQAKSSLKPEAK